MVTYPPDPLPLGIDEGKGGKFLKREKRPFYDSLLIALPKKSSREDEPFL